LANLLCQNGCRSDQRPCRKNSACGTDSLARQPRLPRLSDATVRLGRAVIRERYSLP
jgi:hypothetical protein